MSRIGLQPIQIPEGVTVAIEKTIVRVTGSGGVLEVGIPVPIGIAAKDNVITVSRTSDVSSVKALHGLIRSLVANAVTGVNGGFKKSLEIKGVGYRAAIQGGNLILSVGFSHTVEISKPADIAFSAKGSVITVSGIDKYRVGEVAAQIRRVRPPDSYKGKGIRYVGEVIKLKAGKAAKTAA